MWAAAEGNVEVVEALMKAGADFHARLDSGFTPLLFAVREGRIDAVEALLKAGADVNETIETGPPSGSKSASGRGAPRDRHQRAAPRGRQRALRTGRRICSTPAPIRTRPVPARRRCT